MAAAPFGRATAGPVSDDWREEAKGIPVWAPSCALCPSLPYEACVVTMTTDDGRAETDRWGDWEMADLIPDLEQHDTLAAFDRRLALRLGAAESAATEGVIFCLVSPGTDEAGWRLMVGQSLPGRRHVVGEWPVVPVDIGFGPESVPHALRTADPLLARVRAWRSVP